MAMGPCGSILRGPSPWQRHGSTWVMRPHAQHSQLLCDVRVAPGDEVQQLELVLRELWTLI
jgi:hypothetical protein